MLFGLTWPLGTMRRKEESFATRLQIFHMLPTRQGLPQLKNSEVVLGLGEMSSAKHSASVEVTHYMTSDYVCAHFGFLCDLRTQPKRKIWPAVKL